MKARKSFCAILFAAGLVLISSTTSSASVSGDVDDDGVVRIVDALLVLRHLSGTQPLTVSRQIACDVAGGGFPLPVADGVCDMIDIVAILRKAYGVITF